VEKMQIDSKIGCTRSRVINGYSPHRMLEMIQKQMLTKIPGKEVK
jgi:hypothetical protein